MDEFLWAMTTIVGPIILLGVLIWLVVRARRTTPSEDRQLDQATDRLYDEEERRRREGTDDL